jgi:DNA-binding transcriptional LysR family regulator
VAENIDVALRMGTLTDSASIASRVASGERLVFASPAYLARRGIPQEPSDLANHDAAIYKRSTTGDEWCFQRGSSEVTVQLQRRLMITAAEGVRAAVIAGQGLAIASRWMFTPELQSGEVVSILNEWSLPPLNLSAVYPSGRFTSTKARAFMQWFEHIIP